MKVLILEDSDMSIKLLENDLNSFGVDYIKVFKSGVDALDHLTYNNYDLVIADIKLPDIDGVKFVRSFRQTDFETKVIVISGSVDFEVIQSFIGLRVEDVLCKPYSVDRLLMHLSN